MTAFQIGSSAQDLTLFSNLSPAFSDPGYTFADWNTAANGSGTTYSDGENYSFTSDLVLYAQWDAIPTNYTVTFVENDTGTDSVTAFQIGSSAQDLTLFSNLSPAFSNPGYTFAGWNTAANGSGTSFSNGEDYDFNSDLELFAQWDPSTVTATFADNGGAGSISPTVVSAGSDITFPAGTALSDIGYNFESWNTAANGSGTTYQPGSSLVLSANETFYAQWIPDIQISFSANGGVGSISDLSG
ncbi:MAG: InlB B-repeat-containing protein, partial [Acidimicrobiales bacterium]